MDNNENDCGESKGHHETVGDTSCVPYDVDTHTLVRMMWTKKKSDEPGKSSSTRATMAKPERRLDTRDVCFNRDRAIR